MSPAYRALLLSIDPCTRFFIVTIEHLSGSLAGLTSQDVTTVERSPGVYRSCVGGARYRVVSCVPE